MTPNYCPKCFYGIQHPLIRAYIDFRTKFPIFVQDVKIERCDLCGHEELSDPKLEKYFEYYSMSVDFNSRKDLRKKISTKNKRGKHEFEI